MAVTNCDKCGHPIFLCDVCRESLLGKERYIRVEAIDAWGRDFYYFCSKECFAKWLFELAPTALGEPSENRTEAASSIHIWGLGRCNFVTLVRGSKLHSEQRRNENERREQL